MLNIRLIFRITEVEAHLAIVGMLLSIPTTAVTSGTERAHYIELGIIFLVTALSMMFLGAEVMGEELAELPYRRARKLYIAGTSAYGLQLGLILWFTLSNGFWVIMALAVVFYVVTCVGVHEVWQKKRNSSK